MNESCRSVRRKDWFEKKKGEDKKKGAKKNAKKQRIVFGSLTTKKDIDINGVFVMPEPWPWLDLDTKRNGAFGGTD